MIIICKLYIVKEKQWLSKIRKNYATVDSNYKVDKCQWIRTQTFRKYSKNTPGKGTKINNKVSIFL